MCLGAKIIEISHQSCHLCERPQMNNIPSEQSRKLRSCEKRLKFLSMFVLEICVCVRARQIFVSIRFWEGGAHFISARARDQFSCEHNKFLVRRAHEKISHEMSATHTHTHTHTICGRSLSSICLLFANFCCCRYSDIVTHKVKGNGTRHTTKLHTIKSWASSAIRALARLATGHFYSLSLYPARAR